MKKIYKTTKYFIASLIVLASHFYSQAQMIITPNMPANQMVDRLVGAGVTYTNPTLICPAGASGRFDNAMLTTIAMDSGIVLTSGSALNTSMNAGYFTSVGHGTNGGDAELQAAATGGIHDLCKLEFDFIPIGDTVKFFYRFGSEEYTNYTCSNFNDIFSFFISGPGYGAPTNVALIPGTNCPVSINTVNGSNANPCGPVGAPCAPPNNALYINNAFGATVVYDGLTQKIMAQAAVTPCSTYHMKFAIADVYDGILDSGVFLEAGSFVSEAATITNVTSTNNIPAAPPFAIEGCNPSVVTISRPNPKPYPQTVNLTYAGTATNGVDFPWLPPSVVIPANAVNAFFVIPPIEDYIAEGPETLKIYVYGTLCANYVTDSVTIDILEFPNYTVSNDDTICAGQTATLTAIPNPANPNLTFNWSPAAWVSPAAGNVVTAFPNITTTFTVTATYPGCPLRDSSMTVYVEPSPTISLTATPVLCAGNTNGSITATGNVNYFPISFTLQPNMITQTGSPTTFSNLGAGTYTVTVSSAVGCTTSATISIVDPPVLSWQSVTSTNIPCGAANTGQISANAQGGVPTINYQILPGGAVNNTGNFSNLGIGVYTIAATDANGCSISTTVTISQPAGPVITNVTATNPDCNNQNGEINVVANGMNGIITYTLNPGNMSNVTGIFNPLVAGTYTIQVVDASQCTSSTVVTLVIPPALTVSASTAGISCFGGTANISVGVNGGTPAFQYSLNGGANQLSNTFTNITVGVYTISVTDANGCTGSTTISITQPPVLQITNINATPPSCIPGNDGSMTISATGGTVAYSFNIGGANQASNSFSNLGSGTYIVTVTDGNGCTATSNITIAPPNSPTITNIIVTDVTCNGGNDGGLTTSASGGIGALSYTLQPGNQTNASGIFTNLTAGVYTVTVGDANGCTVSSTVTILQPAILNWTFNNVTNISCNGGNDGDINVAASGGNGIINYTLLPNNISNVTGIFSNLTAGTYTMNATDANGCTISTTLVISQAPAFVWATINITNVTCNGDNNGAIDATATGGTGLISYLLQPNNVTNVTGLFSFLTANIYTLQATDANGCSISTVINVTQPALLQIINITANPASCIPGNDGSISVTVAGGTPAIAYNIGGANQAGNVFNNLGSGNYTVTVTDANGCTATSSILIASPNSPAIGSLIATDVTCNGLSNGTITVTANGGIAPLNYNLQPGNQNNASGIFNNLGSGIYTIIVGDANGCTVSSTATITEPAAIIWVVTSVTNINCNGGSDGDITVSATGGAGNINYNLMPNNINNITGLFTNLTAGFYTVTATDANGCTLTTILQINQPPAQIWTTLTVNNITCNGTADGSFTVVASGGIAPINYNLQPNNVNNQSGLFTNLAQGIYTLVATDASGCTISTTLPIIEPSVLQVSGIAVTQPSCIPGNDGSITITASGGTVPYNYNMGGANQINNLFMNVAAGNYTVTVTDANGCTATSTLSLTAPNSPSFTSVQVTNVNCNGGADGSITAAATGGIGALNYNLQPGNQNNASGMFNNLVAGVYTITVGDANGCTVSSTATIIEPALINWTLNNVTNVNCNGGNDGDITIAAAGGTGIINYNLQPNNITNASGLFPNLAAGNYTMTATDANGCTLTIAIQITQVPGLVWATATSTNVSCYGGADGAINTNATGGAAPVNYNLQPNNINNANGQFAGLIAGAYTVQATDANGCTITTILNITEPPILQVTNLAMTQPSCVPGNDGTLTITASGGTVAYAYNIGGANQPGNVFNNLGSGNYTVTVTDANGCTATSTITIAPPNSPTITNINTTDVLCNGGNDGTITTSATGGIGALNYNLQPGNQNNANGSFTNLTAGVYTITVGDANGCTVSSTATIIEPALINWTLNNVTNVNCNGGNDGDITIAAAGGTGIINYNLQPNNITNASGLFPNLAAGNYTMTATDANGCTLTIALQIIQAPGLVWATATASNVSCNGGTDGAINTNATGGAAPLNYNLQPNNINNANGQFAGLIAGAYTVQATDANGCTITTILNITEPPILQVTNLTMTAPSCVPGNDGTLTITATGGTVAYAYNIGGANQPGNVFNNLGSGNYTVTVTDANGCTATSTITIAPPNSPTITNINTTDVLCNGGNDGTITTSATGGIGALNYNLQPGNQNNANGSFANLTAGFYTITVGDANGCTVSSTATIIEPALINWTLNNVTNVNCNGGNDGDITIAAAGGTGIINYNLQPNNITNASGLFPNLAAGNYTMTATDANGCTLTIAIQITQAPGLVWATATASNVSCNGGADGAINTNATGGAAPVNYNLQPNNINNANGQFAGLIAGAYTVQATDANGCTITTILNITEPPILQVTNLTMSTPSCVPGNDGSLTITATGGTVAYAYNIGGANQPGNVFNNLGSGNYTVTVTDANGCTATSTITIAPPNSPTITNINTTDVLCNGGNDGTITTSATGGIGALNYNLQPGNQNNANGSFANLTAGIYTITVGDANGCTVSSTATIIEPALINWTLNNVTNVNCNGGNDGDITIAAAGGTGIINYNLQPNNITNASGLFPNLAAGNYTMTATDANSCTLTIAIQITQVPGLIWATATATNVSCNGGTDGAINTNATGGAAPLNYNLQPNNINNANGQFAGLIAGAYTVQATDANGCTITTILNITEPPILQVTNLTMTAPSCVPGNDGTLTITATGGTVAYAYNIGGANQPGNVFNNLGSGNYTVTVTDANGCTATSTITIAPPNSPTITNINTTDVLCNGGNDGTITTSATGGIGALNYNLQPGNQNNANGSFANLTAGIYTITVGDANGCTVSSTATIIEPALINWTLNNVTNVNCNGGNDGDITIAAAGGTGIINYNLQPNNITNASGLFPNLAAGNYTMTATDANGCTLTIAIQITQAPGLVWATATASNVSCNGGADGAINTNATGGAAPVNYNLQPNNINNANGQFAGLIAGAYTVQATDANGCTITTILNITEPPILQVTNLAMTQPSCVPGNDGTLTITASGGTVAYAYSIGGANQPGNVFNNLGSGNYTVTVTDANGCTATSTITISPPNSPTITNINTTDVLCNGGNDGTITTSVTGGIGALNYNLQPGNQNNANGSFANLTAGIYTITVGDANGCTVSSTATIIEPALINWTLNNVTNVNCNGGNDGDITIAAAGGTGIINYNLQPNNITNASGLFPNLAAGNYTMTATDANGCTLTIAIQITQAPGLVWATATASNVSCNGGADGAINTNATGGAAPVNYNLQPNNINNANGQFAGLIAGAYTVQATDANGCTITTILNITEPPILQVTNLTMSTPSCVPGNDGSLTITATGGTVAYAYSIGGANQPGNVFNNLGSGNYTVTVTDANGCTATSTINIAAPNSPTILNAATTLTNCNPGNTGTVTITATGGNGIYNYSADGINFQLSNTIAGLTAGNYTITVQDALGCTASSLITINTPPSPTIANIAVTDATCVPGCDATATITAAGGNAVYTYSIDNVNFQANNLFTNVCANVYTATVSDGNGCTATSVFTISTANAPVITLNNTVSILCNAGNNGAISVSAIGAGAITYVLLPNGINNLSGLFTNLTANIYTINATDANGCSVSTTVTLSEPAPLVFTNVINNGALCSGANNGTIDVSISGGTGGINYSINPVANFVPPSTFNNLLGNTTYTVTATDANGCSVTSSVFIAQPLPLSFTNVTSANVNCFGGTDGSISAQATGGTGILNYALMPNPQNNLTGIFNNLNANIYTVTVTDANNCTLTTAITLSEPTLLTISTFAVTDITCSNMNNGVIAINCTGGTGIINYNLQPANITNLTGIFNNLPAAIYTIIATDANGCTYTTSSTITNPSPLIIDSLTSTNILCSGGNTAAIMISASGGTGILNYNIVPLNINNANGQFLNLTANNYTITITDANLCTLTTIVSISEPLPLTASVINLQNVLCSGGNSGQVDIGANGGTLPYTFTILPLNVNNLTGIFANLAVGTYTVNVVDSNQCTTVVQPIVIIEPTPVKFDLITKEDIKCFGDASGTITITASGGTGTIGFTILPNTGIQNPPGSFSSLTAGTYTIVAADANNCTLSTTVTLNQNSPVLFTEITFVTPKCWGEATGIIQLTAIGGVGQLTYFLDNQFSNASGFFNQLTGGNYLATAMDSLGCRKDSAIILMQPERLQFSNLQIDPVFCKGYSDGKIISTATGGNGGYTYYLRPGLHVNNSGNFINLHEGVYTLSIRDSKGCEFDTIVTVSPPLAPMDIYISKQDLKCFGNGTEGWALANMIGGNPPFTYFWSTTPAQNDAKAVNLFFGYYFLEVTDAKGCTAKDSVYIEAGPCCEEVFIPNAFSPNGDGNNDVFRVTSSAGIELIQFDIYDRWGKRVWSTNDFRSSWDGMDRGEDSDVNTYYYVFRYRCLTDGENYMKKGDINLIR